MGTATVLSTTVILSISMIGEFAYSRMSGGTGVGRSCKLYRGGISYSTFDAGTFVRRHNSMHLSKSPLPESGHEFSVDYRPTTALLLKPETTEFSQLFFVSVDVPLWPIVAILAIPTAYLWRTDRRAKPWQCAKCRYDLRGLDGGVCPECGDELKPSNAEGAAD